MITFDFDPKFPEPCNHNWNLKNDTDDIRNEFAKKGFGTEVIYQHAEYFLKVSTQKDSILVKILHKEKKSPLELTLTEIIEKLTK
jgi:uncharacterized protein Smg (DUF494 family)